MNRLHEIRANSDTTEWNYVPGEMNATDHCIRYTPLSQLMSQTSWIDGAKCLKDKSSFNSSTSITVDEENVSTVVAECHLHIATSNTKKHTQLHKLEILLVIHKVSETYSVDHEVKRKKD